MTTAAIGTRGGTDDDFSPSLHGSLDQPAPVLHHHVPRLPDSVPLRSESEFVHLDKASDRKTAYYIGIALIIGVLLIAAPLTIHLVWGLLAASVVTYLMIGGGVICLAGFIVSIMLYVGRYKREDEKSYYQTLRVHQGMHDLLFSRQIEILPTRSRGGYGSLSLTRDGRIIKLIHPRHWETRLHKIRFQRGEAQGLRLPVSEYFVRSEALITWDPNTDCIKWRTVLDGISRSRERIIGVVMPYLANHVDLMEMLKSRGGFYPEDMRWIGTGILNGLIKLNQTRMIHRDIKPENIMVDLSRTNVKLVDMGMSRELPHDGRCRTICGTELYMAPEIRCRQPYDSKAESWSFGMVLWYMACGNVPEDRLVDRPGTWVGDFDFHYRSLTRNTPYEDNKVFKDLLRRLLTVDPSHRLSLQDARRHPFFLQ